jgi:hypothetical protein
MHKAGLIVTVAVHPGQILPKEVYGLIDRIHLMTYDMIFSQGGKGTDHHATFDNGMFC